MKKSTTSRQILIYLICAFSLFLMISASKHVNIKEIASPGQNLNYHNAYWVAKIKPKNFPTNIKIINDMYIDTLSKRVTVYAQSRVLGKVLTPPQIGPGERIKYKNRNYSFHPNAVYLNGSGKELNSADGKGAWWVKHSWILDGEGYQNWELLPKEYYGEGIYVEGIILDDKLSMKIGPTSDSLKNNYNIRTPILKNDLITYRVTRYGPKNTDPEKGEIDLSPTEIFNLNWKSKNVKSPLNGQVRSRPKLSK